MSYEIDLSLTGHCFGMSWFEDKLWAFRACWGVLMDFARFLMSKIALSGLWFLAYPFHSAFWARRPHSKEVTSLHSSLTTTDFVEFSDDLLNGRVTITIISSRPHFAKRVKKHLGISLLEIKNGRNYQSFAKLVNDALMKSGAEYSIILSDKVFPSTDDLVSMLSKLKSGYGVASSYRFGCFGVSQQTLSTIGYLDERFAGGGMKILTTSFDVKKKMLAFL